MKIITLQALDHEPSYEDTTYYGKLLCSILSINLHWQDRPFITYLSLQMQLREPLVLVQLVLASQI